MKLHSANKTVSAAIVFTGLMLLFGWWWWHPHNAVDASTAVSDPLAAYMRIEWNSLLPGDPASRARVVNRSHTTDFSQLKDSDPRAQAFLMEMREQMERATPVTSMDGEKIRISGYLVPLEYDDNHQIMEFLLVPYFGACIHTPPPPPNQIIHVFLNITPKGEFMPMDQVEIAGVMEVRVSESEMGKSAYTLWADALTRLAPPGAGYVR